MPGPVSLPPKFKRVITEEGRSCVRTDVVFVHPEKPKKDPACSRETSVSKETSSKAEVCSPERRLDFVKNTEMFSLKTKVMTSDQCQQELMYLVNQSDSETVTCCQEDMSYSTVLCVNNFEVSLTNLT